MENGIFKDGATTAAVISLVISILSIIILNTYNFIWTSIKTFPRDFKGITRLLPGLFELKWTQWRGMSLGQRFNQTVKKFPNKICFYYEDEKWTLKQVQELGNQVGNYFSSLGYKKGDVIGLFMENCVDYVAITLGLSKIGVVTSLINTNLRLQPLKHSITIVNCKALIYSEPLSEAVEDLFETKELDTKNIPLFVYNKTNVGGKQTGGIKEATDLVKAVKNSQKTEPIPDKPVTVNDALCYIYTSGTTGLPKAAVFKHARFFLAGFAFHRANGFTSTDIMYGTLPLYHSAGGVVGLGQPLLFGTPLVIKKKFSAKDFWKDCIKYNVTVFQYIGEICRYLLAQPESPEETAHKVRLIFGNGLRKEIWQEFTQRFKIRDVTEMYGSTEGNCNLLNCDGRPGAVGFIPNFMYPFFPVKIIKVDEKTGEILRDPKTGLAIFCAPNEPGELVGKIVKSNPLRNFEGYADSKASRGKVVQNVYRKGDSWFRSGDVLLRDELGYIYFRDRSGDTFRWKGENVSTAEVEGVMSNNCDLKDCAVYGVQIPKMEGRAGMATINDPEGNLNLKELAQGLSKQLPPYARPVFLRITKSSLDMTGTYKMKKTDLQGEGFHLSKVGGDALYIFKDGGFEPLTEDLYKAVLDGKLRL